MNLNAPQRQQLHDALLEAFPRWSALKQMVDYGLDENLEKIAGNSNLSEAVFELIMWARARDRIEELISTALKFNPTNVQLCAFAQEVGITIDAVTKKDKINLPPQPSPDPLQPDLGTATSPQIPIGASHGTKLPQPPIMARVIPLGTDLSVPQPPAHVALPHGYRYLGKLEAGLSTEHLYRERDGHITLWFPAQPGVLSAFLIDKYAVTVQQVSMFLNDAVSQGLISTDASLQNGVTCCRDRRGRVVALDAQEHWQSTPMQFRPVSPWGMTYQNGQWQPIAGCELLPATLISWWGARLYSLWAHHQPMDTTDQRVVYLPTARQWQLSALFDPVTKRQQPYPWGDFWERGAVNYAGYWAGQEVHGQQSLERWRLNQPDLYKQMRPYPVSFLPKSCSPIGCIQLIGNVWEWCADVAPDNAEKRIVKGGACNSPQEYCLPDYMATWSHKRASEYIGFRCALQL